MEMMRMVPAIVAVGVGCALAAFVLPHLGSESSPPVEVSIPPRVVPAAVVRDESPISGDASVENRQVTEVPVDAYSEALRNPQALITNPEAVRQAWRAKRAQGQVDALLAAGFTLERIQWLRRRTDELILAQEKETREREKQGLGVDPLIAAYVFDSDLRLAEEIGVDEYERYRKALGRQTGIKIQEVPIGTAASNVGLQPGDEIIGFDGKRVFNSYQLTVVQRQSASAHSKLDIKRNGQQLWVIVPNEQLGLKFLPIVPFTML